MKKNENLLKAYELMLLSRYLDEKMLIMLRQNKSFFHIGCMGHEAIQAAAAFSLEKKRDFIFPYYRDLTLVMGMGMTPKECLLGFLAKGADPSSGGRQMPQHYGHKDWNIPSSSSSTGTQFLQAVGCALATKLTGKSDQEVTLVCAGDGTTSQGDFHEALNWATREQLPVIFLIENNGYAISVPLKSQRPEGDVASLGKGYPGLTTYEVDGCDFLESYKVFQKALKKARQGEGPILIDASVVRLLPHSSSDDHKKYRAHKELEADQKRDPIIHLETVLLKNKIITEKELKTLKHDIKKQVDQAADEAESEPGPDPKTAAYHVWSEETEPEEKQYKIDEQKPEWVLVDAINRALKEEMERNPSLLVFGQDVAYGKGGVFTATRNLTEAFGERRCFNAPLAESSIVGVGIGLALRGYKPAAEIQFGDYVWTAMMQIRNELSTFRYRSNGAFAAPMVIRIPIGGYIHGGLCHSQNIEATFAHFPGLKIALPSTAYDAYGLLKNALRGQDPVLFLEHKGLYRQNFAKSRLPDEDCLIPFGKGVIRREGHHATVVTYGALVQRSLEVAKTLSQEGIELEVIDLRTIVPYDLDLICASVAKTNRLLIVHEDVGFVGFGAEIAAQVADTCFDVLDAPIMRVAGQNAPVPFHWDLEAMILPQSQNILDKVRELVEY